MIHLVDNLAEMETVIDQLTALDELPAPGEVSITIRGIDCLDFAPQMLRLAGVAEDLGVVVNNKDSIRLLDRAHTLVADTRQHLVPAVGVDPLDHDRQGRLLAYAYALRHLGMAVGSGIGQLLEVGAVASFMNIFIERVHQAIELFWNGTLTGPEFFDAVLEASAIVGIRAGVDYIRL
ncbi:hypothetical protein ACQJBY_044632 [Aegilops geniculata]